MLTVFVFVYNCMPIYIKLKNHTLRNVLKLSNLLFIPKDCGSLNNIGNGKVNLTDAETTKYGATATQSCYIGYDLTCVA